MRKVAKNYSNSIYSKGYISPAVYAELSSFDDEYGSLTLKKGFLHSSGYASLIPVSNFSFIAEETAKSDRSDAWLSFLDYSYAIFDHQKISDIQPIIGSSFTMFRFFEKRGVLESSRNYMLEFEQDHTEQSHGIIRFSQDAPSDYSGKIYYDENFNLKKIKLDRVPFYQPLFQRWITVQAEIHFSVFQDDLFLSEISVSHKHNSVAFKSSILIEDPVETERIVSDNEFRMLEQYKINPLVHYSSNVYMDIADRFKWLDIEQIKKDFEHESSLEEQFINNSGGPFVEIIDKNGAPRSPFYLNEVYPEIASFLRYIQTLSGSAYYNYNSNTEIYIQNRLKNYGITLPYTHVEKEFTIQNVGVNNLYIYGIRPDCTIYDVDIDKLSINPGDKAIVTVRIMTTNRIGKQRYNVVLETNTYEKFHSLGLISYVEL
ncbi:MAG: DUF1573 domain-containing protein [Balneolales bacterium]|nr:DUF1573 domain-containing protein [Balneolales bacterium]